MPNRKLNACASMNLIFFGRCQRFPDWAKMDLFIFYIFLLSFTKS